MQFVKVAAFASSAIGLLLALFRPDDIVALCIAPSILLAALLNPLVGIITRSPRTAASATHQVP